LGGGTFFYLSRAQASAIIFSSDEGGAIYTGNNYVIIQVIAR
jgi:hypothetical protein